MKWMVLISLALASTAGAQPGSAESERQKNRRALQRLLVDGEIDKARRFEAYFLKPEGVEHELMAQLYLSTCRARKAETEISKIQDASEKDLFEAVLWALVSVERPILAEQSPKAGSSQKKEPFVPVALPLGEEVWRDEWADIRLREKPCAQMPLVSDRQARARYLAQAKQLFEKIPSSAFERDMGVAALAMDVGARLPNPRDLVEHHSAQAGHPYYRRLIAVAARDGRVDAKDSSPAVRVSAIQKNELALSELNLNEVIFEPHAMKIPVVLRKGASP